LATRGPRLAIIAVLGLAACRWGAPEPVPREREPHYEGFDVLVDLAAHGDRDAAQHAARELSGGSDADSEALGAALGFVQMAEDEGELADGVASAAAACGNCHRERGIRALDDRPAWKDGSTARWAIWGLVWNDASAPPGGWPAVDSDERDVAAARVARILASP
jgi:hypothetical protein